MRDDGRLFDGDMTEAEFDLFMDPLPRRVPTSYSAAYLENAKFESWSWGFVIGVLLGWAIMAVLILTWH